MFVVCLSGERLRRIFSQYGKPLAQITRLTLAFPWRNLRVPQLGNSSLRSNLRQNRTGPCPFFPSKIQVINVDKQPRIWRQAAHTQAAASTSFSRTAFDWQFSNGAEPSVVTLSEPLCAAKLITRGLLGSFRNRTHSSSPGRGFGLLQRCRNRVQHSGVSMNVNIHGSRHRQASSSRGTALSYPNAAGTESTMLFSAGTAPSEKTA